MTLHDDLDRAIRNVLADHPDTDRAMEQGPEDWQSRGGGADALQDLIAARNALLDAAGRWDRNA